jgi:hypothetical protein
MKTRHHKYMLLVTLAGLAPLLTACGLLHKSKTASVSRGEAVPAQANPGEHEGIISTAAQTEAAPVAPSGSPRRAVERFAAGYINWTYRTLGADAARLAASAVGEARTLEEQTRARAAGDTPLRRAHIYNSGSVMAVVPLRGGRRNEWVVVTREQTGGDREYAGTEAAFHVTLATVRRVAAGHWAVSGWHPEV